MLIEKLVSSYVEKRLGKYVIGLDAHNFKIALFKGDVRLKDLELNPEGFTALPFPIVLKQGKVGELALKIPWNNLGKKPIEIHVRDVLAVLSIKKEWTLQNETDRLNEIKKHKLKAADLDEDLWAKVDEMDKQTGDKAKKASTSSDKSRVASAKGPVSDEGVKAKKASLAERMKHNVRLVIQNIQFRFEDDGFITGTPFAMGITLQELSAETADDKFQPFYLKAFAVPVHRKLIKFSEFAVYWNTELNPGKAHKRAGSEAVLDDDSVRVPSYRGDTLHPLTFRPPLNDAEQLPISARTAFMSFATPRSSDAPSLSQTAFSDKSFSRIGLDQQPMFVLCPVSGVVKLSTLLSKSDQEANRKHPRVAIDIDTPAIHVKLHRRQLIGILQFSGVVLNYQAWLVIRTNRPHRGPVEDPKSWWKYAYDAVRMEMDRHSRDLFLNRQVRALLNEYVSVRETVLRLKSLASGDIGLGLEQFLQAIPVEKSSGVRNLFRQPSRTISSKDADGHLSQLKDELLAAVKRMHEIEAACPYEQIMAFRKVALQRFRKDKSWIFHNGAARTGATGASTDKGMESGGGSPTRRHPGMDGVLAFGKAHTQQFATLSKTWVRNVKTVSETQGKAAFRILNKMVRVGKKPSKAATKAVAHFIHAMPLLRHLQQHQNRKEVVDDAEVQAYLNHVHVAKDTTRVRCRAVGKDVSATLFLPPDPEHGYPDPLETVFSLTKVEVDYTLGIGPAFKLGLVLQHFKVTSDGRHQVLVTDSDQRRGTLGERIVPTASVASVFPRSKSGLRSTLGLGSPFVEDRLPDSKMLVQLTVKCSTDHMIQLGLDLNPLDVVLDLDWASRITRFFHVPQSYRLSSSVGKAMKSFRALQAKTKEEIRALFGSRLSLNARAHITSMHFVIPQSRHGSQVLVASLASIDVSSNNPSRVTHPHYGLRSQDSTVISSPVMSPTIGSLTNPDRKSNDRTSRDILGRKGRLPSRIARLFLELEEDRRGSSEQPMSYAPSPALSRPMNDLDKYEKFHVQCENVAVGISSSMPIGRQQDFETHNVSPLLKPMNLKFLVEHLVVPDEALSSFRVSADHIQLDFYRFVLESFVSNLIEMMSESGSAPSREADEESYAKTAGSASTSSESRPSSVTEGGKQRGLEINFGRFGFKLLGAVHSELGTQWAMEFSSFKVELLKDSKGDLTMIKWRTALGHMDTKALHADMVLVVSPWIDPLKEWMKEAYKGAVLLVQMKRGTIITRNARSEAVRQYKRGFGVQDKDGLYMRMQFNVASLSMALYHTPVPHDIHDLSKAKVPLFEPFNLVCDHDLLMVEDSILPKLRTRVAPTVIRSSVWSYKKLLSYHGYQWSLKALSCHIGTKNFLDFLYCNMKHSYLDSPEILGRYFAHTKVDGLTLIGLREGASGTRHPAVSVQLAAKGNRYDTRTKGGLPYSLDIAGTLSIDLINPKTGAFEPVLEPWQFTYEQYRSMGADGAVVMQAALASTQVMNINLVMDALFFWRSYWYTPTENFAEYTPPFDRVGTEFWVQNQTGFTLTVFSAEAGPDDLEVEESKLSASGRDTVCGLSFPVLFRAGVDDECSRAPRTAVVEIAGAQFEVPMDCPGSYVASLSESGSFGSSQSVPALVMDVFVDQCHMLRIRSPLTIQNDTNVAVEVVLTSSPNPPSHQTLSYTTIFQRGHYVVPLWHKHASFAWLRPSDAYGWSSRAVPLNQQVPFMEVAVSKHLSDAKIFAFAVEIVLQERYSTWGKDCGAPPPTTVTILPPLIIQNLLPLSAEISVFYREVYDPRSPNHDKSGSPIKQSIASASSRGLILPPGEFIHVHDVVPAQQSVNLMAALKTSDGAKSAWSDRFSIGSGSDCVHDLQVHGLSKPIRFAVTCSWKWYGQSTEGRYRPARVVVQLHSSVWLVNNTSVDLWVRVGANQQWILLNSDSHYPLISHVSPGEAQELELSFGLPGFHSVKVPLKKTHPRDSISLSEPSSSGVWNGKGLIQLRMAVNAGPGDFALSRLVSLYPSLAVANGSHLLDLRLRQSDTSFANELVLLAGQTRPWVWPDSTKPLDLAVKLDDDSWSWSSPVPYDTEGNHYCFLRHSPNTPARRALLKYEIKANRSANGGTFVVLVRKVTMFEAPIRVVNLLSHPATMQQQGVAVCHLLPPFSSYPYAWDNLQSPPLDLLFLLSTQDGGHEKVTVDPSTLENHLTTSRISIAITTEQQFKVITISPPPSTAPLNLPPREPSNHSPQDAAAATKRLIFAVRLPEGAVVTLIDTLPQEILALSLSDINFEMLGYNKDMHMFLNVGDIQLDNQARHPGMPPYPVLVCRRGGTRPALIPKPMLSLTLLRTENIDKYTLHFKQLLVQVQDLDVSIDDAIAARVYEMYKLYFSPAKYADYDSALLGAAFLQQLSSPPESWPLSGSPKHRIVWDHVQVETIEAAVTFAVYPANLNMDSRSSGSLVRRFRRGLASALVNVYRAPIKLNPVFVRHQQINLPQLGHLLRDQYKDEFLRAKNIIAVLASLGIIGAPASTISSIAEGVVDLYSGLCISPSYRSSSYRIRRPRLRSRQGSVYRSKRIQAVIVSAPAPREIAGSLSSLEPSGARLSNAALGCMSFSAHLVDAALGIVGNVTKSLGKGLRGLTIDPTRSSVYGEHERVARRPQNFIEGSVLASRMIYGDLCAPSHRDACHPRAVLAFVIRPISTAFTAFGQITDGIQSSARQLTGVYDTRPIRPPRLLRQSQVSDYNFELALAADLERNCFPSLDLTPVALCHTLRGYFVVTHTHILTYYQSTVGLSRGVKINVSEIVNYELWRGLVKSQVGLSFRLSPSSRTIDRHPIIRFASLADAALALALAEPVLSRRPCWVPTEPAAHPRTRKSMKARR